VLARSVLLLPVCALLVPQVFAQSGIITTVAGTTPGYSGDGGLATEAHLGEPFGLALDTSSNLYIADEINQRIRKVTPSGIITTVAGNGTAGFSGDGGLAVLASLNYPSGIAIDTIGNLYITEEIGNRIRKVTPDGIITTIAGTGTAGFGGDGGPAIAARLNRPRAPGVDSGNNLYFSDRFNNRIRKITPAGIMTTVVGNGTSGSGGDAGPAINAQLGSPEAIALDSADNLFIADTGNNRIRKVTGGVITTVSLTTVGGAVPLSIEFPHAIVVDGANNLFVAGTRPYIYRVGGVVVSMIAGTGADGVTGDGGPATAATLDLISSLVIDRTGNLYLNQVSHALVRKIALAAVPAPVRVGSFAQIASGSGWKTTMTLVNLNSTTVTGRINLYADDGSALSLPLTFPQTGGTLTASFVDMAITPNGSLVVESEAAGPLAVGWADVRATGSLTGQTIFRSRQPGLLDSEGTATFDARGSSSVVFSFDNTSGFKTGIAFANQSSTGGDFTAILRDDTGAQLLSIPIRLSPFGHRAFFLDEGVPQAANRRGIVEIQNPAGGITGVGLRFSPAGSFTSVPIIR
jgi:hypothetical protein